ncbi:MAG TPA: flavin reductase family protein [candidate division WOR-3 bacterium]|uniref:Flavin reductase family protein n=1 Tax=candidate division WOR-3 bacterium TaxID=2052148 RepID=A0A7V5HN74_UNCW3|nr:flavin reductase family protein [candidate division WOR-3 bacterium]
MKKTVIDGLPKTYYYYPLLVAVVGINTTRKRNLIPVVWHTALSFSPPLYAVSISPRRFSFRLILEAQAFTVNFLGYDHLELVDKLGSVSGRDIDKFSKFNLKYFEGELTGAPVLEDAYLTLECELIEHLKTGDHTLFTGEVLRTYIEKRAFLEDSTLNTDRIDALLYLGNHVYITTDKTRRKSKKS